MNMRVIIFTIYLLMITVVKADFGKRFEEKDSENDNIKAKDGNEESLPTDYEDVGDDYGSLKDSQNIDAVFRLPGEPTTLEPTSTINLSTATESSSVASSNVPPSPTSLPVTVSDQNPTSSEVTISTSYESDKELLEQTQSSVVNEISSTVKAELELSKDTEKTVSSETMSLPMTTPSTEDIEEMDIEEPTAKKYLTTGSEFEYIFETDGPGGFISCDVHRPGIKDDPLVIGSDKHVTSAENERILVMKYGEKSCKLIITSVAKTDEGIWRGVVTLAFRRNALQHHNYNVSILVQGQNDEVPETKEALDESVSIQSVEDTTSASKVDPSLVLNEEMDRPENKMGQGETTMRSDEATLLSLSNVESTSSTSESLTTKTTTKSNDISPTKNGKIDTTLQNNELSTSETIDGSTQNTVPSTSEKSVETIPETLENSGNEEIENVSVSTVMLPIIMETTSDKIEEKTSENGKDSKTEETETTNLLSSSTSFKTNQADIVTTTYQSNNGITANNVIETTKDTLLDGSGNGDLDDDLNTIVGSSDKCVGYNGIAHPKNPTKCCASTCGDLCGALNCDEADGGANACCGSGIQDNVICGLNGQKAPCSIVLISDESPNQQEKVPQEYSSEISVDTTLQSLGFSTENAISTISEENNVNTSFGAPKIDIEYDAATSTSYTSESPTQISVLNDADQSDVTEEEEDSVLTIEGSADPETTTLSGNIEKSTMDEKEESATAETVFGSKWSDFTNWTPCTHSCGLFGYQRRTRTCTKYQIQKRVESQFPGCRGFAMEERSCNRHIPCPVNGQWTAFGRWSDCSTSCGSNGTQYRYRSCTSRFGGIPCEGASMEERICNRNISCLAGGVQTRINPDSPSAKDLDNTGHLVGILQGADLMPANNSSNNALDKYSPPCPEGLVGLCITTCSADSDCPGEERCCLGCGRNCVDTRTIPGRSIIPSEYEFIEGYQNCIDFHETSSNGKTAFEPCLPQEQPEVCINRAWKEIQDLKDPKGLDACSDRDPSSSDVSLPNNCGWTETITDEKNMECGERCHTNPFNDLSFYCQKGEKCCPLGAQSEKCLTSCGPYDDFKRLPNGTFVPIFGECTDMSFLWAFDCCPIQDAPCNLECRNDGVCGYSSWVREKQQFGNDLPGPNTNCEGDLVFSTCHPSCPLICGVDQPNFCTTVCVPGCGCPNGLYRSSEKGTSCFRKESCPIGSTGVRTGNAKDPRCDGDLVFSDCHSACPQVCGEEPKLLCTKDCIEGCGCPKGLVRSFRNSTTCVKEDDCTDALRDGLDDSSVNYDLYPDLDECKGKKCGEECDGGLCNGGGVCNLNFRGSGINAGMSPCFAEGCDGKTCGDQCLSGGILGSCNQAGECVNIELVTCDCDGKQCADECQNGSTVGACNQDGKCITDGSSLNCECAGNLEYSECHSSCEPDNFCGGKETEICDKLCNQGCGCPLDLIRSFKGSTICVKKEDCQDVGTRLEGETCGDCFNPSSNFTCGKCVPGLECVPDEDAALLPDLPSLCRVPKGSDLGICLEDTGEGLVPDNDCISCMQPPKQGCADGYIMHDLPSNNSCTQIICTRPGSQFCVTIVTGNEDDGILEVSIDKIHFQARKFRRGERVIDICLPKLNFIVLKNPTNDGWTGEIAITRDGRPRDIDCINCNGEFSQGKLSVGGKDREGTNHGPILVPVPVILAYWDRGACGPNGDDHNWQWCNRQAGTCPAEISTGECDTGKAVRTFFQKPRNTPRCRYFYYSEYTCTGTRGSQGLARDPLSFVGSNTTDNKTAEFVPFQQLNATTSLDVEGYVKSDNTWSIEACGDHLEMIMPIDGGLEACKEKCNNHSKCTAFEYALTTYTDEIDCCVLRKCPFPVPKPKFVLAEWHTGSYFDYTGYAKDSGVLSIIQETDGYKECFLKQNSANESSMTDNPAHCLPMKKPENCAEDAWYELSMLKKNEELNVEQCPIIEERVLVCGDCYGAKTKEHPCCNTCEEVREAYERKVWKFSPLNVQQCVDESLESPDCDAKLQEDCGLNDLRNYRHNFKPVCGSDDETYNNLCELEKAKCENKPELKVQYEMACHGGCRDEEAYCRYVPFLATCDSEFVKSKCPKLCKIC